MIKPTWVKYKDMGGPLYRGEKRGTKKVHVYDPGEPWGVWSQVLGVVARCEGTHDTVVMYDETGVTAFFLQWTFKSGRLQNLLQFMKGVPSADGVSSVFDKYCVDESGRQIFSGFGFRIDGGWFVTSAGKVLNPAKKRERDAIVDVCMGRRALGTQKAQRRFALDLCAMFARLGQEKEVQDAAIDFAKVEFKRALKVKRSPLKDVGWRISSLLPGQVWGTPIPAIFFNLYQNSPGGAFRLFKGAWKEAHRTGVAFFVEGGDDAGYGLTSDDRYGELLDIIWTRLNRTKYADWGFGSKQYIESGGKNSPRIMRIKPAIKEFYDVDLPYDKRVML